MEGRAKIENCILVFAESNLYAEDWIDGIFSTMDIIDGSDTFNLSTDSFSNFK